MIIDIHRKYNPKNIIFICLIGSLLCIGAVFHLPNEIKATSLEPAINNLLTYDVGLRLSPNLNVFLTLILTLIQAFLLNKILSNYNFFKKPNFLTALMYITLVSTFLPFLILSPALICNFITIWMLKRLFDIYKQLDVKRMMFDLGIIVAVGSFIYFPFIVMLLLLWIALIIYRPFIWREWLSPLLGFANIYFLIAVAYYWLDKFDEFKNIFSPFNNKIPSTFSLDYHDIFVLIPIAITFLLFLFVLKNQYYRSVVQIRKALQLLFAMIILTIGSFYLSDAISINHFLLSVPPLAIYFAYYFTYAKSKWLYETLYYITIGIILYFQFI